MTIKQKLAGFPKINWISLSQAKERQNFMINQFNKYFIEHNKIEAYDGKLNDYENSPMVKPSYYFQNNTDGSHDDTEKCISSGILAITMSHLKMIKHWLENSAETETYGFMAEDDLNIENIEYWNFTWLDLINKININKPDWEIIQLNIIRNDNLDQSYLKFQKRDQFTWGAAGYIIKRLYAKNLIKKYIENDIYVFKNKDFYVPTAENIIYGIVRDTACSIPLFIENISFKRSLEVYYSNDMDNHIKSSNFISHWWKEHYMHKQLDLLFNSIIYDYDHVILPPIAI